MYLYLAFRDCAGIFPALFSPVGNLDNASIIQWHFSNFIALKWHDEMSSGIFPLGSGILGCH